VINVDNTKEFTVVEWCAGYGGIHLGLERVIPNLRVIAFSEIEAFACANLVAKMEAGLMDTAPIWTDLKTFPCEEFRGKVDLLVAGYPCQPFSTAGKRAGADDPRHLWPFIRKAVGIIQPRYCFFENVDGHISLGLSTVISDMEEDGYRATWGVFSAAEVGAPHQRKRVFILAHNKNQRADRETWSGGEKVGRSGSALPRELVGTGGRSEELANRQQQGLEGCQRPTHLELQRAEGAERSVGQGGFLPHGWPARPGEPQHGWEPRRVMENPQSADRRGTSGRIHSATIGESSAGGFEATGTDRDNRQTQPALGRDSHGSTDRLDNAELYESCDNRTDELRLLGNGVVPATAARAWEVLCERLEEEKKWNQ